MEYSALNCSIFEANPELGETDSTLSDAVKVVVRVRPLNQRELTSGGAASCIDVLADRRTVRLGEGTKAGYAFQFDFAADQDTDQESMFLRVGKPIVDTCVAGYNGTIFCYGQTGSGKTFTMTGPSLNPAVSSDLRGLIPRIFDYLIVLKAQKERENAELSIKISFFEIYMEQITDLLDPSKVNLNIREDRANVFVEGITEETCNNYDDLVSKFVLGNQNRHVGATQMNKESSRSHSLFIVTIKNVSRDERGVAKTVISKLNLIDLAGSERAKSTGATGTQLDEAKKINKSLSCLGQVIMNLTDVSSGKQAHVHYRDSKLTFLLKDSLGGNSKTCIIANVSPAVLNFSETLSTVKFAAHAKKIKNKPVVNEELSGASSRQMADEIRRLREENARLRVRAQHSASGGAPGSPFRTTSSATPGSASTSDFVLHRVPDDSQQEDALNEINYMVLECMQRQNELDTENKKREELVKEYQELFQRQESVYKLYRFILKVREYQLSKVRPEELNNPRYFQGNEDWAELSAKADECTSLLFQDNFLSAAEYKCVLAEMATELDATLEAIHEKFSRHTIWEQFENVLTRANIAREKHHQKAQDLAAELERVKEEKKRTEADMVARHEAAYASLKAESEDKEAAIWVTMDRVNRLESEKEEFKRQLQHLKRQLEESERAKDVLNESLKSSGSQNAVMIANMTKERQDAMTELSKLQGSNASLEEALTKANQNIADLNKKVDILPDLQNTIRRLEKDLSSATEDATRFEQEAKQSKEELRKAKQEISVFEDKLMTLTRLEKAAKENYSVQQENAEKKLTAAEFNLVQANEKVSKLEQECKRLAEELDEQSTSSDFHKDQLEKALTEKSALSKKLEECETKVGQLEKNHKQILNELAQKTGGADDMAQLQENNELRAQMNTYREQNMLLESKTSDLQRELSEVQNQLQDTLDAHQNAVEKSRELHSRTSAAEADRESLRNEASALRKQLEVKEANEAAARMKITNMLGQIQERDRELENDLEIVQQLERELVRAKEDISQLQLLYGILEGEKEQAEKRLEEVCQDLKKSRKSLAGEATKDEHQNQIVELNARLEQHANEITQLKADKARLEEKAKEIFILANELKKEKQEKNLLQNKYVEAEQRLEDMETELQTLRAEKESVSERDEEVKILTSRLEACTEEIETQKMVANDCVTELEHANERIARLEEDIVEWKHKHDQHATELARANEDLLRASSDYQQLNDELSSLKSELNSTQRMSTEMTIGENRASCPDCEILKNRVEELTNQLEQAEEEIGIQKDRDLELQKQQIENSTKCQNCARLEIEKSELTNKVDTLQSIVLSVQETEDELAKTKTENEELRQKLGMMV